jgi:hypothetical protein
MANKRNVWTIMAIILAFAVAVTGCDQGGGDGGGDDSTKSITITGLSGRSGDVNVAVLTTDGYPVAMGMGTISGGSVTVPLLDADNYDAWTGSGSFIISLWFDSGTPDGYLYTDGKTMVQLGINNSEDASKLPKYSITSAVSTIPFSKFQPTPSL